MSVSLEGCLHGIQCQPCRSSHDHYIFKLGEQGQHQKKLIGPSGHSFRFWSRISLSGSWLLSSTKPVVIVVRQPFCLLTSFYRDYIIAPSESGLKRIEESSRLIMSG